MRISTEPKNPLIMSRSLLFVRIHVDVHTLLLEKPLLALFHHSLLFESSINPSNLIRAIILG
jgi:hypothetical protein